MSLDSALLSFSIYKVSDIGMLARQLILHLLLTCPLVTVCVLLLDLVIALAKSYLVLVFSVEDTPIRACSLSQQPSLSVLLMVICNVYSVSILTYFYFSGVRKPILDKVQDHNGHAF